MSIAITGANGQLGTLIIQQLLLRSVAPHEIIACVRRPELAQTFEEQGISVRVCDYDKVDSLESAFAGAAKLLFISSSHHDDTVRIRQHAQVIEAAKKAKVGHLLYTSFAFADHSSTSLTHLHLATEHAIQTTGIPFTFLRNALYMDFVNVLDLQAAVAAGELVVYPGDWAFNSVTRLDLAAGIAAVLAEPGHHHQTYELAAARPWTFADLAAALSELANKPVALRQDPQITHWIYGFLNKIDTASTSPQLEQLTERHLAPLKESIRPFL
jgi:NAD(P)H dehydrogenase (quinone)